MTNVALIRQVEQVLNDLKAGVESAIDRLSTLISDWIEVGDISNLTAVTISNNIRITVMQDAVPEHAVSRLLEVARRLEESADTTWIGKRNIRIFLASPGDVTEERGRAKAAIRKIQNDPLYKDRVEIEIVAWDDPGRAPPLLAAKTPQEAISEGMGRPSGCDIVIAIFWSKMGTPLSLDVYVKPEAFRFPNKSGKPLEQYYSGTEWEYIDAMQTAYDTGLPYVLVYRRVEAPKLFDPDRVKRNEIRKQFELLEDFFASFKNPDGSIRQSYNKYRTPDEFQSLVEQDLRQLIVRLLDQPDTQRVPDDGSVTIRSEDLLIDWPEKISPFPGLRAFTPPDEVIFFGREKETAELLRRVGESGGNFLAVIGASGSGKSSLIGAGLIPKLAENAIEGSRDWLLPTCERLQPKHERQKPKDYWLGLRVTPAGKVGDDPFHPLARQLAPLVGEKPRDLASRLANKPEEITELLERSLDGRPMWAKVLFFVDQFEELFTIVRPDKCEAYARLLFAAAGYERAYVIVTVRADFADRFSVFPPLNNLMQMHDRSTYWLSRPKQSALYEMIIYPARMTGLVFEKGLDWQILDDIGNEPGALALVAYTLEQLWQNRTDDGLLTWKTYQSFGGDGLTGVEGAIGAQAQMVYNQLVKQLGEHQARDALQRVFRELVLINQETGAVTRRSAPLRKLREDAANRELIAALVDARLLVTGQDESGWEVVEVAHEALFRSWPMLAHWLTETRDDIMLLRQVTTAAHDWQAHERDEAFRWPHGRLALVYTMLERMGHPQLEPLVQDFIRPEYDRLWEQINNPSTHHQDRARIGERLDELGDCEKRPGVGLVIESLGQGRVSVFSGMESPTLLISQHEGFRLWGNKPGQIGLPDIVWLAVRGVRQFRLLTNDGDKGTYDIPDFYIAKYPITYRQYRAFLEAEDGFRNSRWWSGLPRRQDTPGQQYFRINNHPADTISWYDAIAFCRWLNARLGYPDIPPGLTIETLKNYTGIRLPTEWEWHWAAQSSDGREYPWGPKWDGTKANTKQNRLVRATAVGMYPQGAAPCGALDMSGGVWEWCLNEYRDPTNVNIGDDVSRVVRGGSWSALSKDARTTTRYSGWTPLHRQSDHGFRVVCCLLPEM